MKSALVCGLGTAGLPFAMTLGRLGFEHLTLVDFDRVETKNLAAQPYLPEHVGRYKVHAARELLRARAEVSVSVVPDDVRTLGVGAFARVDLLAACPDNRAAELALSRAATVLGKPFLRLATARRGLAVTLVPPLTSDNDPCSGCLLTADDVRLAHQRESCLSHLEHNPDAGVPTLPQMGALVAALACDALTHQELGPARIIALRGGVEPLVTTTRIVASPGCRLHPFPFCHGTEDWHEVPVSAPVGEVLALACAMLGATAGELIVQADVPFCPLRLCQGGCEADLGPGFLSYSRAGVACPRCGSAMIQEPALTVFDATRLDVLRHVPLASLHPPLGLGLRFATAEGRSCAVRTKVSEVIH